MTGLINLSKSLIVLLSLAIVLAVSWASLSLGTVNLTSIQVWQGLWGQAEPATNIIVQELRLPRLILGLAAGATLAIMGAALQGLLRNPLADPGVIGVSASASLGAVIAIYFGLTAISAYAVPLLAMAMAGVATMILFFLAMRDSSALTLILTGIGISSLATAFISLVMNIAPTPGSVQDMVMWMLGSLENRTTVDLMLAGPFIVIGWLAMIGTSRGLDALSLGEDAAHSLGININRLRWQIILGSAVSVGAVVSVCGGIGFVGLVVPHMVRAMMGSAPGRILLPSALLGGALLIGADMITRLITDFGNLRLGVVTAIIGAPVFLLIVYRTRESMR
jgi:iron complex transport system permease protein